MSTMIVEIKILCKNIFLTDLVKNPLECILKLIMENIYITIPILMFYNKIDYNLYY